MNDQGYNEPRLDETTPAANILNVSYCIGNGSSDSAAHVRHSGVPDHCLSMDQSGSGRNTLHWRCQTLIARR